MAVVDDNRKAVLVLEDNERRIELMRQALESLPNGFTLHFWDNAWTMRAQAPKAISHGLPGLARL